MPIVYIMLIGGGNEKDNTLVRFLLYKAERGCRRLECRL
jgi:hypothetical protein